MVEKWKFRLTGSQLQTLFQCKENNHFLRASFFLLLTTAPATKRTIDNSSA